MDTGHTPKTRYVYTFEKRCVLVNDWMIGLSTVTCFRTGLIPVLQVEPTIEGGHSQRDLVMEMTAKNLKNFL